MELKYEPRPIQQKIRDFVAKSIQEKEKKFMFIDAPVGTGKSFASVMVMDWYIKNVNKEAKFDVLTNTKVLQEQYMKDFGFFNNLKGKDNYFCEEHETSCAQGEEYSNLIKHKCPDCPYKNSKHDFLRGRVGLTNFHLFINFATYAPKFLDKRKANVLIIDEANYFEEVFCGFISSKISRQWLKKLEIWDESMTARINSIKDIYDLCDFTVEIVSLLESKCAELKIKAKRARAKKKKLELLRKMDLADRALCKYGRFTADRRNYDINWIFETDTDQDGYPTFLAEPIWGRLYLNTLIWQRYDHVILMSGTILDKNVFSSIMGIKASDATYKSFRSPFEKEKRPIFYVKAGKMSYDQKEETFPLVNKLIQQIVEKNPDSKGIIHAGNYEISKWIQYNSDNDRFIFHASGETEAALNKHYASKKPTVLVSPTMINGVDLKDDFSRFQIITKVPYPHLGSEKNLRRLKTMPSWYLWKTLGDIIQQYGRSIRNKDDWAKTYILDSCFDTILWKAEKFIPEYFMEAITTYYPNQKKKQQA